MKNFKPGQKVIFKHDGVSDNPQVNLPKEGEEVTIHALSTTSSVHWFVKEYPIAKNGKSQSLAESCLFPLQSKTITLSLHEVKLEPKEVLEETKKQHLLNAQ